MLFHNIFTLYLFYSESIHNFVNAVLAIISGLVMSATNMLNNLTV